MKKKKVCVGGGGVGGVGGVPLAYPNKQAILFDGCILNGPLRLKQAACLLIVGPEGRRSHLKGSTESSRARDSLKINTK